VAGPHVFARRPRRGAGSSSGRPPGPARRRAWRAALAEGWGRVIAAGGDGFLSEVIEGLAPEFSAELGVAPIGTGNDFARWAGIPTDIERAFELIEAGATHRVDVARLEGRRGASRRVLNPPVAALMKCRRDWRGSASPARETARFLLGVALG
jgi:hypothetical protein